MLWLMYMVMVVGQGGRASTIAPPPRFCPSDCQQVKAGCQGTDVACQYHLMWHVIATPPPPPAVPKHALAKGGEPPPVVNQKPPKRGRN